MKLQFRLRTLMIVVTLLAVPLGYVGCAPAESLASMRERWYDAHALELVRQLDRRFASTSATSNPQFPCGDF